MFSFRATWASRSTTSASVAAGTRTGSVRLRTASRTLLMLSQTRMRRHALEYFSMVRRSACCASRDSLSTSFRTSTAQGRQGGVGQWDRHP